MFLILYWFVFQVCRGLHCVAACLRRKSDFLRRFWLYLFRESSAAACELRSFTTAPPSFGTSSGPKWPKKKKVGITETACVAEATYQG